MEFYPMEAGYDFSNDPLGELLTQLTDLAAVNNSPKKPISNDTLYTNELYNPDILEMLEAISFYCDSVDEVHNNAKAKDKKTSISKIEKELISELRILIKRFK
jgi:hypothetical protein